jgi:hypothetical protein
MSLDQDKKQLNLSNRTENKTVAENISQKPNLNLLNNSSGSMSNNHNSMTEWRMAERGCVQFQPEHSLNERPLGD